MALQAVALMVPLAADGVTQVQHPAELFRSLMQATSRRAGVGRPGAATGLTNTGDFALTVVPGAMQATLAAGKCFIPGQENTLQSAGDYFAYSEAIETISWPAASGSNRMDTLLLQIADPQYGSIGGNPLGAAWRAVAGSSASARPDTDFKSGGSQYVPGAWIRMYDVLVPASATQLTQANVTFKAGYSNINGSTPMFSAARPAGLDNGELGYEVATGRRFQWHGPTWVWAYPRGFVGGNRYNGGIAVARASNGTAEALANIQTPSLTLEANRAFEFRWTARIATSTSAFVVLNIHETNIAGASRARGRRALPRLRTGRQLVQRSQENRPALRHRPFR